MELDKFQERVTWRTHFWFKERYLKEIVEGKGQSELTEIVENFSVRGSQFEDIAIYAEALKNLVARAFNELSEKYPSPLSIPETWEQLKRDGLQIEDEDDGSVFQMVGTYIENTRYRAQKAKSEAAARRLNLPIINTSFRNFDMSSIKPKTSDIVLERHDNAIKETERLSEEIEDLNGEIALLKERIPALEKPTRLIYGFLILAYFSIVGIVYPLIIMTRNPVVAGAPTRNRVLAGFCSGLVLLLGFIWNAVSDLRKAALETFELHE